MINKWLNLILSDVVDKTKIPVNILERFETLDENSEPEDYRWLFEDLGHDFDKALFIAEKNNSENEEQSISENLRNILIEKFPKTQNIVAAKNAWIEFEVWNNLLKMFDHNHDNLKYREESFLKYIHDVEEEWKYKKLRRLAEIRAELKEKQSNRKFELELKERNAQVLTDAEQKEMDFYKSFDKFQHDHKGKVLSDMLRVSEGEEEAGFAGINFDSDFKQFNNPEFVEEVRTLKEEMHQKILSAEALARDKVLEVRREKGALEKKMQLEYRDLEIEKEQELVELENIREKDITNLQEQNKLELESAIQHKETELHETIEGFESEKQKILEDFENELAYKLEKIEELNVSIDDEKIIQEEIEKRNQEEITRLQAEWNLINRKNILKDLRVAKKKELISLADDLQIDIPSKDIAKTLRAKIIERVDQLELKYSEKDMEEIIEKRIAEITKAANEANNDQDDSETGSDAFGGGGDAFGGGGDAFGGGGDAFGGGGDAFGGGGDAFGGGGDAFGGGGDAFGGGGDAFGGGGDAFGGGGDAFGGGGDAFGGGGDAFGGGGDAFGGGGDAFGGGGDAFGGGGDAFGGGGDAFGGGGDAFGTEAPEEPNNSKKKKAKKEEKPKPDKFAHYVQIEVVPDDWETFSDKDKKLWVKEYESNLKQVAKEEASKIAKKKKEELIAKEVEERAKAVEEKLTKELELKQAELEKKLREKEEEFNNKLDKQQAVYEERIEDMEKYDTASIKNKATDAEEKLKEVMNKLSDLHKKDEELDEIHEQEKNED